MIEKQDKPYEVFRDSGFHGVAGCCKSLSTALVRFPQCLEGYFLVHFLYLQYWYPTSSEILLLLWRWMQCSLAALFVLLVGVSTFLTHLKNGNVIMKSKVAHTVTPNDLTITFLQL